MRERESEDEESKGGLCADQMGLGSKALGNLFIEGHLLTKFLRNRHDASQYHGRQALLRRWRPEDDPDRGDTSVG